MMGRKRANLNDLELQGSPNVLRAKKLALADAAKPLLDASELDSINELIASTIKECKTGVYVNGPDQGKRKNPAFAVLESLVRTRAKLLLTHRTPDGGPTSEDIMRESDQLLGEMKAN